jgi:phage repressor protein C with HTH and peptisase S24 domain
MIDNQWIIDGLAQPGKTKSGLAKALGIPNSAVTEIVKNGRHVKFLEAQKAAKYLGVDTPALSKQALVGSFDPDAPEQPNSEDMAVVFPPDAIKELAAQAGLGGGQTIETTYKIDGQERVMQEAVRDDYWRIPPYFVRDVLGARIADLLIVECKGDSMVPTVTTGDRAVVNTAHKIPSPDGLYAIRNAFDEVVVKRLQSIGFNPPRIRIISDNPAHVAQEVGVDEIAIVGRVTFLLKLT